MLGECKSIESFQWPVVVKRSAYDVTHFIRKERGVNEFIWGIYMINKFDPHYITIRRCLAVMENTFLANLNLEISKAHPFGPRQFCRCSDSVKALNTSSRGALFLETFYSSNISVNVPSCRVFLPVFHNTVQTKCLILKGSGRSL